MTHKRKSCEGISPVLYHSSPSKNNVSLMTPLQWGPLLPTVSYTLGFYRYPMQREGRFLAQTKRDLKFLGRAVSQVTCTPSAARLHPQGLTPPSPPPSAVVGLWAQPGCLWPLSCLVEGKKKITE